MGVRLAPEYAISLFVIFFRGAWNFSTGAIVHILSIDENMFSWGFMGKEKSIPIKDLKEIYWNEHDGLNVVLILKDNSRMRLWYIESVLGQKSQKSFLEYMHNYHPHVKIEINK